MVKLQFLWMCRRVTGALIPANFIRFAVSLNLNKYGFQKLERPEDVGRTGMIFFTVSVSWEKVLLLLQNNICQNDFHQIK